MLKKISSEIVKVFISPTIYILALVIAGTALIWHGTYIVFGEGIAAISLGVLLLAYMVAISRSVSVG